MKYLALITAIFLVGCGSDDENSVPDEIVGVWDDSQTEGQLVDEWYFVIRKNGQIIDYDYLGDSYDNYANCYDRYSDTRLVHQGNNLYTVETDGLEPHTIRITASEDTLSIGGVEEESPSYNIDRSSRLESSFTPLCD